MTPLLKFVRLPSADRNLLVKSALLLGAVRLGLWLLPFQTMRRLLASRTYGTTTLPEETSVNKVTWAVTVAGRYVPVATCLTQALAVQVLLGQQGLAATLRIGVARGEAGQFQAHAWVEYQGRVVIGGIEAPSRFTPLPLLEGKSM
jgi:Transglutaminase-like superfamily